MARQELKTVGVKELKNNLSAWLREVRRGTRVLVTDRDRIVAELHEPGTGYATAGEKLDPVLARWVANGTVTLPRRQKEPLPDSPVALPDGTGSRLLDADRSEGHD
jgi:antitoxin (DNA-binding transcriptional repressor) of toxin-antitoxin stability system